MNPQLKRGTLELCVLAMLSRNDCYGYELVDNISSCMNISEGTIYPLLKRLKDNNYIDSYLVESSSGPSRKYYSITTLGKDSKKLQEDEWHTFVSSVDALLKGEMVKNGTN